MLVQTVLKHVVVKWAQSKSVDCVVAGCHERHISSSSSCRCNSHQREKAYQHAQFSGGLPKVMMRVCLHEILSEISLIFSSQSVCVVHLLEEMRARVVVIRDFFHLAVKSVSSKLTTFVIINLLERSLLMDVGKSFTIFVDIVGNNQFSKSVCALNLFSKLVGSEFSVLLHLNK